MKKVLYAFVFGAALVITPTLTAKPTGGTQEHPSGGAGGGGGLGVGPGGETNHSKNKHHISGNDHHYKSRHGRCWKGLHQWNCDMRKRDE